MNDKFKLLLAEDEELLGKIVKESLESRDFEVVHCKDGEEAMVSYQKYKPDLLILDVMMPKQDGFSLAKKIREDYKDDIPIIFLTAKSQNKDVIEGFEIGADDYMKKPFSVEELIVRVGALLKRGQTPPTNQDPLEIGRFSFSIRNQHLVFNKEIIKLTSRESALLKALYDAQNKVLDRTYVLNKLWNSDDFFAARSMDVFISKLRKKLQKDPQVQIVNVRGYGYKLVL